MRMKKLCLIAIPIVTGLLTYGQDNQDKVYHFTNTHSAQAIQEIATVIRWVADLRQVSTDTQQKTMTAKATAGQIALADWLFNLLDRPTDPPVQTSNADQLEYQIPGGVELVRVFYLKNAARVQDLQEIATTTRSILNIPRLFTYNELRTMAVRGSAEQISAAEWLLNDLDQTARSAAEQTANEYWLSAHELLRVFYLPAFDNVQRFQQIVTHVREATQVRWAFTYNAQRAVAFRGTPEQIAQADQLFKEGQQ